MRKFRKWLSDIIAPPLDYEEVSLSTNEAFGSNSGFSAGIEFSIKHVQNGYIIATKDNDAANARRTQSVEASDIFKQCVVPDGEELLPHIIAILAARKLK